MLFFELFPALLLLVCIPVFVRLVALERQARRQPAAEPSGEWGRPGPRA